MQIVYDESLLGCQHVWSVDGRPKIRRGSVAVKQTELTFAIHGFKVLEFRNWVKNLRYCSSTLLTEPSLKHVHPVTVYPTSEAQPPA